MVGGFLGAMEATVGAPAMPTVVASLGGLEVYSWVFSSSPLTPTLTVPLWGKFSDLYGRRPFYLLGIALFLLGSVACGFSRTMTQLILFRGVQGLGAGAILALGLTIIGDIYPFEARARLQVLIVALVLFLLGVMGTGWRGEGRLGLVAVALVGMIVFGRIERRAEDPLIPLRLFENRIFLASFVTGLMAGVAVFGAISFVPLFVQAILGTDATAAGSVLTPFMLAWVLCSILGARLLLRYRVRAIVLTGGAALSVGFLFLARLGVASTRPEVMAGGGGGGGGGGMGLMMAPLLIAVQTTAPRSQLGLAPSVRMFSRTVGGAIGVSLLGAVMARH